MLDTEDILLEAVAWRRQGLGVAVATVVATWGSSPRPVGSKLAVSETGDMRGSVSAGCVEAEVVEVALEVMRTGRSALLEYGVSDEESWEVGLACGGRIRVYVEVVA
jgi:xanthine/CO dehydrogenase XdhC/CoxF family maturation factor